MVPPSIPKPPSSQPCYVMSLRDPATRLESVVRYARASFTRKLAGIWPTTQSYLDALRNPVATTHRLALGYLNRSIATPRYVYRKYQLVRGINGLTAQLDYFRGLDCSRDEIHFVCQERFESDWHELLRKFRLDPSRWNWMETS